MIVNLERRNFKGNTDKKKAVVQKKEHRTRANSWSEKLKKFFIKVKLFMAELSHLLLIV